MPITGVTPILNVSDVPASLAWFETLGWKRGFSWNSGGLVPGAADRNASGPATFASVLAGEGSGAPQVFLCCGAQGSRGTLHPRFVGDDATDGVWMSWWLDSPESLAAMHQRAIELGYHVAMPPTDKPWGVREFHLRHPDGHTFRVSSFPKCARE